MPDPITQEQIDALVSINQIGAHGTLMPLEYYQFRRPGITPIPARDALWHDGSFKVIGLRIDPCADPADGTERCSRQLRLIVQHI